ncbi:hypothetical protein AMTR_s00049p00071550 [Amborella trichopoda]|uniref:AAA+ ATPase domain-containing protein n=1 Tax=Amborella trichopoda TaxID=13333 RepID=W1PZL4_AMBTC|nr:hypothetical protein AMTR_s00049p00071550 [Amborella trichopoda]
MGKKSRESVIKALQIIETRLDRLPPSKRLKKVDREEERLLHLEKKHLHHSAAKWKGIGGSDEEEEDSDEEDGEVSSSEEGYDMEPSSDLMKSMMRSNYGASNASAIAREKMLVSSASMGSISEAVVVSLGSMGSERERMVVSSGSMDSENEATVVKNLELELIESGGSKVNSDGIEDCALKEMEEKHNYAGAVNQSRGALPTNGSLRSRRDGPTFKDLGGMKEVLDKLLAEVVVPLFYPQLLTWLGVRPVAGILLHGPPGCGKTKLAHAIANETGVPLYKISATEVVSGVSGASEENIRNLFTKARRTAPSIIFIDEIDAIGSKRENLQREMERRIVTQLLTCMDQSHQVTGFVEKYSDLEESEDKVGNVLVIGATNRPDAVDPALRRPGRFDREIFLGIPDENARMEILSLITQNLRLEGSFDFQKIARLTPGYVGADLEALKNEAGNLAMARILPDKMPMIRSVLDDRGNKEAQFPFSPEEMEKLSITMADFEEATKKVQPSTRREGFSSIPDVRWEDVGGLSSLRNEFDRYIVNRIKNPEDYEELGMNLETGFLLYGPPGCGKTLIAKAVANEAGANFIHIKGPELLSKYVGESELAVRILFNRARACSPCILFFDEVDALATKRGTDGGQAAERLLNQLLIELDGADQRKGVYVIGATNRPEVLDKAVLRPGRLGKLLYVPLPSAKERELVLRAVSRKMPLSTDVDLGALSQREACNNLSGADLASLVNEAAMAALEEKLQLPKAVTTGEKKPLVINASHFENAMSKVVPSVSVKLPPKIKGPLPLNQLVQQQFVLPHVIELRQRGSFKSLVGPA